MISNEIKWYIAAIENVLLQRPVDETVLQKVDYQKLEKTLWFHSVRPISHLFLEQQTPTPADAAVREQLATFTQTQLFLNLKYAHELRRLLTLFREKNLKVLPYKGTLFIHELYGNKQQREVGDIDLLFHPDSAAEGMRILLNEGYQIEAHDKSFDNLPKEEFIEKTLDTKNQFELAFVNNDIHIDFHWGLYQDFFSYKIDFEHFLMTAEERNFYGTKCSLPNPDSIFWMMLLHHGGRESWLRIKHFADLIAFLNTYGETLNWQNIIAQAKSNKMYRLTLMGFYLLNKHFTINLPEVILHELTKFSPPPKTVQLIEDYWNESTYWLTLFPRLQMERIFIQLKDEDFRTLEYLRGYYHTYSLPNPLVKPRIVNFPDNYPTLNFISKILTYLIRRF